MKKGKKKIRKRKERKQKAVSTYKYFLKYARSTGILEKINSGELNLYKRVGLRVHYDSMLIHICVILF